MLKNKKANILFFLVIAVVLVSTSFGAVLLNNMGLGALVSYDQVYKQNWGHIKCVQNFDYDIDYRRYLNQQTLFKCDDYTNECSISLVSHYTGIGFGGQGNYQVCDLYGNACSASVSYLLQRGETKQIALLPVGKSIKFSPSAITGVPESVEAIKKAKSFYIEGEENGKIYVQESCVLSTELKGKTLLNGLNELSKTGANSYQNYMIDFVAVASQVYSYNGQNVICQTRQLYSIQNMYFKDGSTKKVQGGLIKAVACCPSEANCDPNTFTFQQNVVKECTFSSECANGGSPIAVTATTYYTMGCQEGSCVKSAIKTTECTNTQECIRKFGSNSVCDLSSLNWGNCKYNTKPNYCGNSICESLDNENGITCPEDCSNCPTGMIWDSTKKICIPSEGKWWAFLPWWIWTIAGIIIMLLIVRFIPSARRFVKSLPIIKYLIP